MRTRFLFRSGPGAAAAIKGSGTAAKKQRLFANRISISWREGHIITLNFQERDPCRKMELHPAVQTGTAPVPCPRSDCTLHSRAAGAHHTTVVLGWGEQYFNCVAKGPAVSITPRLHSCQTLRESCGRVLPRFLLLHMTLRLCVRFWFGFLCSSLQERHDDTSALAALIHFPFCDTHVHYLDHPRHAVRDETPPLPLPPPPFSFLCLLKENPKSRTHWWRAEGACPCDSGRVVVSFPARSGMHLESQAATRG